MKYCPECGGEMRYISLARNHVCQSCGISLTNQEIMEMRDKSRARTEPEEEERKRVRKEYLQWWLSKKK